MAMAGRHKNKRGQRSRNSKARHRRVLGAGSTAGAFLAFGMTPLASAPVAHADGLDVITDPIINSILGSVTSLDALVGIIPSGSFDLALPATDAALAAEPLAALGSSTDVVAAAASSAGVARAAGSPGGA